MEEIVLKRIANVTSAEALDQISESYPDSEVFSFRRVKEAGNKAEYFIVRLRLAAPDEAAMATPIEMEAPVDDVIEEDGNPEEIEKLDKIIDMLKEIKGEDEEEVEPLQEEGGPTPLPEPEKPPMGTQGVGTSVGPTYAKVVVERPADVPKTLARVELFREFGDSYIIEDLKKVGSVFRAVLAAKSLRFPPQPLAHSYLSWLRDQGVGQEDIGKVYDYITGYGGTPQDNLVRKFIQNDDWVLPAQVNIEWDQLESEDAGPSDEAATFINDMIGDESHEEPATKNKRQTDDEFWADQQATPAVEFDVANSNLADLMAASDGMRPSQVYEIYQQMNMLNRKNQIEQRVRQQDGDLKMQQVPTTQAQPAQQQSEEIPF